jgi:hypothetical protein
MWYLIRALFNTCAALVCLLALPWQAQAVLFDATGDASYNTNAPTGALTNSGWQFEGKFGAYLGTAVAPHYFLTAQHIGGDTNTLFVLDGTNYHPTTFYDASDSDLRLWHVAERLPRYAPIYTGSDEVGAPMVVIGRGTYRRGTPVVTDGLTNGWEWAYGDNVMRWGSNRVVGIYYDANDAQYLMGAFFHGAGPDECTVSVGDSGGATFIFVDGRWQLGGIMYGVDYQFKTSSTGNVINAAIYDEYGLYQFDGASWDLITNHWTTTFVASRVSSRYAWLTNAITDFDSNANGLPDWWELQYSGDIHGMSPTDDPDHDGMNNLAEWIALTDPTNPASFFQVQAIACASNRTTLTFTGWSNRLYNVYYQDAPLTTNAWILATTNAFVGSNGPTFWTDTNLIAAVTSRFYRIEVSLPP